MRVALLFIVFLLSQGLVAAQQVRTPQVPEKMQFADIELKITEHARREIQADVDALTASAKFFNAKVDRAALYMPFVEQVFREEKLPQDFKYLAIQESGFISDAVSTSNAVGFWQFKKLTASEVGLRVDRDIDERQNIVASSRGAAQYLQKNNFYFNNWLYALQAYQMGAGGAMEALGDVKGGEKKLTIDKKTYWYVKKYLAHKIAFEDALEKAMETAPKLIVYEKGSGRTLEEIGEELKVSSDELEEFNTWLLAKRIPDDKFYPVIIPSGDAAVTLANASPTAKTIKSVGGNNSELPPQREIVLSEDAFRRITLNGLEAIITNQEMTVDELADLMDSDPNKLIRYNDILPHDRITVGQVYYLEAKRGKARIYYHTVQEGESLWMIAQNYGIKYSSLIKKNRIEDEDKILEPGRILWLKKKRPANLSEEYWPSGNTGDN
jgi:membrane-bound lytic murein transglycosylase D